jgi:hypothetical protein
MQMLIAVFKKWLPLAIVTAGLCGLIYLTVQQSLRSYANDPQIQMAEDAASALDAGANADQLVPAQKVDIAASLAPFMMVFDDAGNILASSAMLHNENPALPAGVLDYTRQKGEDRVTWQPESSVRIATVIVKNDGGFVLAGRSLREIEKREDQILALCELGLAVLWIVTFIIIGIEEFIANKRTN